MSCSAFGQSNASSQTQASPQTFAQRFYDWYMPIVQRSEPGSAFDVVKDRPYLFSPELFHALKEDSEAQAKSDELVGLDFDPFLSTQDPGDPGDRYEVGKVTHKGNIYSVKVFSVFSGEKSQKPIVLPQIACEARKCVFVNFYYPNARTDLLHLLKRLAEERQGAAR